MSPPNFPTSDARPANPPLGLDGYCPVVLSEKERWVRGDPRYGVIHRGKTYLFAGPEEAKRFFADPDRYAPVLSGIDVVVAVDENRQVPGKREYGAWYDGRMYLFSSEASFRKFDQDPGRYSAAATQVAQASSRRQTGRWESSPLDRYPMR
jgi:protein disulfide-isomerase